MKATIAKSFKYGGAKETDPNAIQFWLNDLIMLVRDKDLVVKKHALDGLNAIIHN